MGDVVELPQPKPEETAPENKEPTVADLVALVEQMDTGMKLMVGVIADLDARLRKCEIAERKRERKLVVAAHHLPQQAG